MIEQGKLEFGLKWGKYQVVDEMVKVAIFAYEVSSCVFLGTAEFEDSFGRFMHEDSMDVKMHACWVQCTK